MILLDNGINWVWFYDTDKMVCWREHRGEVITEHDAVISFWGNSNGHSGIDIEHFRKTGEKKSFIKDTVWLTNGDKLSLNSNDFTSRRK